MRLRTFASTLALVSLATVGDGACTDSQKIAGVKQEIATIRSHSIADANKIPYAPLAYRIFTITPNETKPVSVVVPAGVDATTVRGVLVGLGIFLDADVPQGSDHYMVNSNGTVTVDYIQTDGIALQEVDVREIHSFNTACQITGIIGYVRGNLEEFTGGFNIPQLIKSIQSGKTIKQALGQLGL